MRERQKKSSGFEKNAKNTGEDERIRLNSDSFRENPKKYENIKKFRGLLENPIESKTNLKDSERIQKNMRKYEKIQDSTK